MAISGLQPVPNPQKPVVYDPDCYICTDPDYARYGLPTCYPCPICGAHVPADDTVCANGHDISATF